MGINWKVNAEKDILGKWIVYWEIIIRNHMLQR